jgi:hypothetical protein
VLASGADWRYLRIGVRERSARAVRRGSRSVTVYAQGPFRPSRPMLVRPPTAADPLYHLTGSERQKVLVLLLSVAVGAAAAVASPSVTSPFAFAVVSAGAGGAAGFYAQGPFRPSRPMLVRPPTAADPLYHLTGSAAAVASPSVTSPFAFAVVSAGAGAAGFPSASRRRSSEQLDSMPKVRSVRLGPCWSDRRLLLTPCTT